MSFLSKIYALLLFFNRGSQRSILVKKNAIGGLLLKGGDVIVSLLLVRETLNYLDVYQYGVWLTLSSILNWINFCNVGLGNGLRNRLGEAIAKDDLESARGYVSTAFICIFAIAASIFLLVVLSSPFISWVRILNIDANEFPRVEFYVPLMILLFLFDNSAIFST